MYNAFLAPGSPCELNIDHSLRQALAGRMTRAVGDDEAMMKSLEEVAKLFEQALNSVFKLMASVSGPLHMSSTQSLTRSLRILCQNSCASQNTPQSFVIEASTQL